jgi:hypothetical protein
MNSVDPVIKPETMVEDGGGKLRALEEKLPECKKMNCTFPITGNKNAKWNARENMV